MERQNLKDEIRDNIRIFSFDAVDMRQNTANLYNIVKIQRKAIKKIRKKNRRRYTDGDEMLAVRDSYPITRINNFENNINGISTLNYNSRRAIEPNTDNFIRSFMNSAKPTINQLLTERRTIDVILTLKAQYVVGDKDPRWIDFKIYRIGMTNEQELTDLINSCGVEFENDIQNKEASGASGWIINGINGASIEISTGVLNTGASYVELPEIIQTKKCIINIKNDTNNNCFIYSLLCGLVIENDEFDRKHADRESLYKTYSEQKHKTMYNNTNLIKLNEGEPLINSIQLPVKYALDTDNNLKQPVDVNDINKISVLNKININVFTLDIKSLTSDKYNVFSGNTKEFYNVEWRTVNLLLYKGHYMLITKLYLLFNHKLKKTICPNCCNVIKDPNHFTYCFKFKNQITKTASKYILTDEAKKKIKKNKKYKPTSEDFEEIFRSFKLYSKEGLAVDDKGYLVDDCDYDFKNYTYQENILICDFEAILVKPDEIIAVEENDIDNDNDNYIDEHILHTHKAVAYRLFGFNTKTQEIFIDRQYIGDDASNNLINFLNNVDTLKLMKSKLNGEYKQIPILFHNGSGYDTNFIIRSLKNTNFEAITRGTTKYISIDFKEYKILDSYNFLSEGLDNLIKYLPDDNKYFLKSQIANFKGSKGLFPYEWFDSLDKLNNTELPPANQWGSKLKNTVDISDEDYKEVQAVWKKYNMTTFKDYVEYYLKIDVYGLADVIMNFRNISIRDYRLDPLNSITLQSFSFRAMLLMTKNKYGIIDDIEMYDFISGDIRGGITQVIRRYEKKSHKRSIHYIDANNLYGWAMSEELPYNNFKWLSKHELDKSRMYIIKTNKIDQLKDMILEVDITVPSDKHDYLRDFPPCPVKRSVGLNEISTYSKSLLLDKDKLKHYKTTDKEAYKNESLKQPFFTKNEKLICDFTDKKNYKCHIETLKTYVKLGCKITKIHNGITFNSKASLKPWVEFNTKLRQQAKNDFETAFYKLMVNGVFGKTMENVRNHNKTKFVNNADDFMKYKKKYIYRGSNAIDKDYLQMNLLNKKIILDKPIYLGFSILDLSKKHMYESFYNVLKPNLTDIKLIYMDTDSFIFSHEKQQDNIYEEIQSNKELTDLFDLSNLTGFGRPEYNNDTNKKVVGKFKHEYFESTEVVAVKPKSYVVKTETDGIEKITITAKGINKNVAKKEFTFDYYMNSLKSNENLKQFETVGIRRMNDNTLNTYKQTKVGLNPYEDKRYWIDTFTSVPYGYKGTEINMNVIE